MKQVILMRTDLGMSVGKMCAQAAHAVNEPREAVVILKVSSEEELRELCAKAHSKKIKTFMVCDAGKTEVPPGTYTCACLGPAKDETIDKITGALPLL